MKQSIKINGQTFADVQTITAPLSAGEGSASYDETSDATAAASDIAAGKTAYVGGGKVTGTFAGVLTADATAAASDILSGKTAYARGAKVTGTCAYNAATNDATATAADIMSGKTAYVAGTKLTGTKTVPVFSLVDNTLSIT